MSDLRVTNLKGRNPGEAPTLPDGVVITGITTVSSVIVGTGITLSSGGINITGVITATSFSGNGSGLTGVSGVSTTGSVNTSGIITATSFFGNGANLTGVSGVSTTGSINTSGIITATSIVVSAGTTALPSISPTGDSNTGIFFPSADTIAFAEGGAEAMRVDSSGRLLIGISTSGNANGGILQLTSGITFPATAVAASDANTLDDYEEGTWTPVLGGSGGQTGQSYSIQSGTYTKVGKMVTCDFTLTLTAKGTITSDLVLAGLPFGLSLGACLTVGLFRNFVGNKTFMSATATSAGSSTMYITFATAATTYMDTGGTVDVANNSQLLGSVTYTQT